MANKADTYNSGVRISPLFSSIASATAGGTGDNTQATGATIDRVGFGSAKVVVSYTATLAAAATMTLAVSRQTSEDGSTWATATVLQAATLAATGDSGGSTETGVVTFNESYEVVARYVRYLVTPNLSAANTDTALVATTVILGGAYNGTSLPVA